MDWYAVLIATVCGGVAGAAGALAGKPFGKKALRQTVSTLVTLVLFAGLFAWARETILVDDKEQTALAEFEASIVGNPAFDSLQEFAPEVMQEVRYYVRTAVREDHDPAQIEANTRQIMTSVITTRLPKASDDAVLNSIRLTVDQMEWLLARGDDSCFRFLFPQVDGGIRALEVFPEFLLNRDYETTQLILSTYDETQTIPTEAQALEVISPIYVELFEQYGQDAVAQMGDVSDEGVDRQQVCSFSIDLYTKLLARDEEEAVTALRWMLN